MSKPEISVLVPVYNVELYLQRCIDSVIVQNFQNWEMILVDDGSTDKSPQICDDYANRDSRIKTIHKKNGGLPSARLAGFQLATGKYFIFLDSDDWLLEGALSTLYNEIEQGYDIVKARPCRNDGTKAWKESYRINEGELSSMIEYGECIINNDIHPYLHSGIYRGSLFSEKVFEPIVRSGISFGEDWFANVMIIDKVRTVKIIDKCVYAYFVNNKSIVGTATISSKTADAADTFLYDYLRGVDLYLERIAFYKNYLGILDDLFKPEVTYRRENYNKIRIFLKEHPDYIERINNKRLVFIDKPFLFLIYSPI